MLRGPLAAPVKFAVDRRQNSFIGERVALRIRGRRRDLDRVTDRHGRIAAAVPAIRPCAALRCRVQRQKKTARSAVHDADYFDLSAMASLT